MEYSGNTLKNMRKEAGYTQQQLADRIGISRETVVAIENSSPSKVGNIKMIVISRWWKVCKSKTTESTRTSFKSTINKFFNNI